MPVGGVRMHTGSNEAHLQTQAHRDSGGLQTVRFIPNTWSERVQ